LTHDDREDLTEVAKVFLDNLARDIANLQQALKALDYKQSYFLAHTLKGAIGIFGMQGALELARALEQASSDEAAEDLLRAGSDLISALHLLSKEMEAALSSKEP
jgi:HPt (histidine-containing phosphotransfer) domain-containing protein